MRLIFCFLLPIAGCLEAPKLRPLLADSSIREVGDATAPAVDESVVLGIRDERDDPWPSTAAPRRPVLMVTPAVSGATEPVFLFRGEPDSSLLDDLERPPLLVASQARRVELAIERRDGAAFARPTQPLEAGARYVLAIGGWATRVDAGVVSRVVSLPFRVAERGGGADVAETFPAAGTSGVDPALPFVLVRFDDDATAIETITLARADGSTVPSTVAGIRCADVGFVEGTCVGLSPLGALAHLEEHAIVVPASVLDRGGAPVGPVRIAFVTGSSAPPPLELVAPTCALDERLVANTCVLEQDVLVRIRGRATGPTRVFVVAGAHGASCVSPRGDFELRLEMLTPSTDLEGTLRLVDGSARTSVFALSFATATQAPNVVIDEIRADPLGPEPAQEYVEIWNAGSTTLDLGGYRISDRADLAGDALLAPSLLPAGGRALVVTDTFDPASEADGVVPAGVPLFRIGSSIGASGLSNAGEPVILRDPAGRRIAEAPAMKPPSAGVCIVRASSPRRAPTTSDFGPDPHGTCTPGAATTP